MASELANQRDEEMYGVMADVRGFLQRREGLPSYISKQQIFRELATILTAETVPAGKKLEAMTLIQQLQQSIVVQSTPTAHHNTIGKRIDRAELEACLKAGTHILYYVLNARLFFDTLRKTQVEKYSGFCIKKSGIFVKKKIRLRLFKKEKYMK